VPRLRCEYRNAQTIQSRKFYSTRQLPKQTQAKSVNHSRNEFPLLQEQKANHHANSTYCFTQKSEYNQTFKAVAKATAFAFYTINLPILLDLVKTEQ
jgi:hypothetical protein